LAFKTLAHNISRFLSIHQSCRANKAILKPYRSLNPSHPFFFDLVNASQLSQWILFSLSCCAHRNLQIIILILSHKVLVRSKQYMAKVRIACAQDFMKMSFPIFDNICSFQSWICFHIMSFVYAKVLTFKCFGPNLI
jgi:hypothetical protein